LVIDDGVISLAPEDSRSYYEMWLAIAARPHGPDAVVAFALAHPSMFGRRVEAHARGFVSWRRQRRLEDSETAFADYIAPLFRRWRTSVPEREVVRVLEISLADARRHARVAA
jgi:hypothetical protein